MSFDQDPGEQARISGGDFAMMCEEMKLLSQQKNTLHVRLSHLLECIEEPPDANCSCHVNPPCFDCVDHSGLREAIKATGKEGA